MPWALAVSPGVSLKGEKMLRRLAAETGGRVFLPSTESQLELVHTALVDEVRNRYLLTYTPTNQTIRMATWRRISVQVPDPTYRVAARERLLRAQARAGEADDRVHGHRSPGMRTCRSPQTTWRSSRTACRSVSRRSTKPRSRCPSSWRSMPAAACGAAKPTSSPARGRSRRPCGPRTSWRSCSLPTTSLLVQDLTTNRACQHRGDRQLQDGRRHGAVRRDRGGRAPARSDRGTARHRRDDRRA